MEPAARRTTRETMRIGTLLSSVTLAALASVVSTSAVSAEHRYEMTFYDARPGGAEIVSGDYDAAIAAARRGQALDADSRLVAATNLCVAYTVQRAFAEAEKSCGYAVNLAITADRRPRLRRGESAGAKALSNRGVLRALRGDAERAFADFRRAALNAPAWGVPERNSQALGNGGPGGPVVAQTHD
jgi:Flp pilus assembly protein TadD